MNLGVNDANILHGATTPGSLTGSNQWGSGWPNMNNMFTTGGSGSGNPFGTAGGYLPTNTSQSPTWFGSNQGYGTYFPNNFNVGPSLGQAGGGYMVGSTYDPQLTGNFFGYLQSQIGQQSPYYPGQLSAEPNQLLQNMSNWFTSGGAQGGMPGLSTLGSMAQTGNPTDVGPAWNAMVAAQQRNIQQNAANLKEQMAAGGNLVGSPYGTAMGDYFNQAALNQNSLLAQMQQQASEAAAGRQLSAGGTLAGLMQPLGQEMQGINQQALTNMYQEWLRTQPQYSPLLNYMYGASSTFPPYMGKYATTSPWSGLASGLGGILMNSGLIPGLPTGG